MTKHKTIEQNPFIQSGMHAVALHAKKSLLEGQTEVEIYNKICQLAVEYGGVKLAWVGKLDEETQHIQPIARYGKSQTYLDGIKISVSPKNLEGHGPTAIAYREQRTVVIQDFSRAPLTLPWHERAGKYGFNSSIAFVITRGGNSYAVITFYSERKNHVEQEIIDLLEDTAKNIGLALERL